MEVMEQIPVAVGLIESIRQHSLQEAKRNCEAVGFLARREGTRKLAARVPLNNHASDPSHSYFVEPWEQFRAEQKLARAGYEIVGVYHSHPQGEAVPSRTDRTLARANELMVIYSVSFDTITAWRETDGDLVQVELA